MKEYIITSNLDFNSECIKDLSDIVMDIMESLQDYRREDNIMGYYILGSTKISALKMSDMIIDHIMNYIKIERNEKVD